MILSHRAKFQLIINFFRVKAISTGLLVVLFVSPFLNIEITSAILRYCGKTPPDTQKLN